MDSVRVSSFCVSDSQYEWVDRLEYNEPGYGYGYGYKLDWIGLDEGMLSK